MPEHDRSPTPPTPPRLLTVAGSDSGGGAGIQADLKTFTAHGGYGMSAITAVTAQNTVAVTAVHPVPAQVVGEQIDAVFDDIGVDAVKIGMLAQAPIVRVVAERLERWGAGTAGDGPPVVLDPVMVAKSGDALLADDAVDAVVAALLPLATLVTPNLPEAHRMLGREPEEAASEEERLDMARDLLAHGPQAVLVKGGHGKGDAVVDLLCAAAGDGGEPAVHRFSNPRIDTRSTHGTGCTLSSAIAARLALAHDLPTAVEGAIGYLRRAMRSAFPLGSGHGPVNHLTPLE